MQYEREVRPRGAREMPEVKPSFFTCFPLPLPCTRLRACVSFKGSAFYTEPCFSCAKRARTCDGSHASAYAVGGSGGFPTWPVLGIVFKSPCTVEGQ